ncbi:MAG: hypothetical protein LBP42_02790 [Treponema sp.]|jgi:hypothetical protein|nr:hypothetical protein [Treponema sp.]
MAAFFHKPSVMRLRESGEREATVLEHDTIRLLIDDIGGMIPEFSYIQNGCRINAHWLPWFRSNSRDEYQDAEHGFFWKSKLLYHIAGNFPCAPNFGPGHVIEGIHIPPHGWTANLPWKFLGSGVDPASGAAWAVSSMESPEKAMPLSFKKIDLILPEEPVHYSSLEISNRGIRNLEICTGWHNTLGAPFLQRGCRISGAAKIWQTPPLGGEFDTTSRLILGSDFSSLEEAPLARGGTVDLSQVPEPVGYTDFVSGLIPAYTRLGWSALVNPSLKLAYICFFTGPKAAAEDDIILRFNDLWMQYGGRPFTPWAPYEGGTDLSYCLGTENAAAAYTYGLEYSRRVREVMGAPTTVLIPALGKKTLRYGVLFAPYENHTLDEGIISIEAQEAALICKGKHAIQQYHADPGFTVLKKIQTADATAPRSGASR